MLDHLLVVLAAELNSESDTTSYKLDTDTGTNVSKYYWMGKEVKVSMFSPKSLLFVDYSRSIIVPFDAAFNFTPDTTNERLKTSPEVNISEKYSNLLLTLLTSRKFS